MGGCSACGAKIGGTMAYSCSYCTGTHCKEHRLPENHHCPGVGQAKTLGPELRSERVNTTALNSDDLEAGSDDAGWLSVMLVILLSPIIIPYFFIPWYVRNWENFIIGSIVLTLAFIFSVLILGLF